MFLKVLQEQLSVLEEQLLNFDGSIRCLIGFASTPLLDKSIKVKPSERKKLELIIEKLHKALKLLEEARSVLKNQE